MLNEKPRNVESGTSRDQDVQHPDRKPYRKPRLEELGDLRSLTLGPSIGPPIDSSAGWPADAFP